MRGDVISVKLRCFSRMMTTLRRTDVGIWFKKNNAQYPHVKYTMLTLVGYIHLTLYKAALNPLNQGALLSDAANLYERVVITQIFSTVTSWENKMISCASGGEIPGASAIYYSKSSAPHDPNTFPTHIPLPLPSFAYLLGHPEDTAPSQAQARGDHSPRSDTRWGVRYGR